MSNTSPQAEDTDSRSREGRRPSRWPGRLGVALWLGAIAFFIQFSLASAAELEPQAAVMGWMFVFILLVVGGSILAAHRLDRHERE